MTLAPLLGVGARKIGSKNATWFSTRSRLAPNIPCTIYEHRYWLVSRILDMAQRVSCLSDLRSWMAGFDRGVQAHDLYPGIDACRSEACRGRPLPRDKLRRNNRRSPLKPPLIALRSNNAEPIAHRLSDPLQLFHRNRAHVADGIPKMPQQSCLLN
jgi:hypothetical protein